MCSSFSNPDLMFIWQVWKFGLHKTFSVLTKFIYCHQTSVSLVVLLHFQWTLFMFGAFRYCFHQLSVFSCSTTVPVILAFMIYTFGLEVEKSFLVHLEVMFAFMYSGLQAL